MNTCYNVVRYMDTSAAAYRLVSAACNLPFMDLKYNFLVRHLQPDISVFERLVVIFVRKMADCRMLF